MRMKLSIIICTRNRIEDFKKFLPSIAKQTRLPDDLIVVDSSDVHEIEEYLGFISLSFPIRYFHTQPGLTLQRNYGVRKCHADLIFFFDDDVELDKNYLAEVEKIFTNDTNHAIGAVGGRVVNPYGSQPQTIRFQIERRIFSFRNWFFGLGSVGNGRFRFSGMPVHPLNTLPSGDIECLSGCCMAFRREVFERVTFDESLARYGLMEDVDISKQTLDAGYRIYYQASARLTHNESPINRLNVQQWAEMSVVNYDYLFKKNWSKDTWRLFFYYWALLGLIISNLHNMKGLKGTVNGLRKVFFK